MEFAAKSTLLLSDQVRHSNSSEYPSLSNIQNHLFFVDGSEVIAAVANRVLIYDAYEGNLKNSLKGTNSKFKISSEHL